MNIVCCGVSVDSYGKNMFEIACDIAVFTTSDKRARRAVDIVAIFSCILKKEGGDIIKIPWKRCNMVGPKPNPSLPILITSKVFLR